MTHAVDNIFHPNPDFAIPCFWEFGYRYNSLYRHWQLNKEFIEKRITEIKNYPKELSEDVENGRKKYFEEKASGVVHDKNTQLFFENDWSTELMMDYSENMEPDIDFFPEFMKASTLSMALSTFENLLGELSEEVAKELKIEVNLPNKPMPYINRYLSWFTKGCGLEIELSKENNKKLDAIREIRNKFIHRISRDIPKNIQDTISNMVKSTETDDLISNQFIEHSLLEISDLASKLESAYIKFLKQKGENDFLNKLGIPEDLR